jgi:hypothetical protein
LNVYNSYVEIHAPKYEVMNSWLMFDQEDFVLDRRNLIYFNLYVITCSAEVHDIIIACISLDESVKVTKFVT